MSFVKLLARLFGRKLAKLVTCIAQREDAVWRVTWASDGPTPHDFTGTSLTSLTDRAAREVMSMYADSPESSDAELQFAIYPWDGNPGNVILDIRRSADGFVARDVRGSGPVVHGSSLEELVLEAERVLPNTQEAVFRWIQPIASPPGK